MEAKTRPVHPDASLSLVACSVASRHGTWMSMRHVSTSLMSAFCIALAAPLAGCGPSQDASSAAGVAGLPRWEGRARELFDDAIEPAAVGLSMEGPSPRADPFLRERAQTAEVVAEVRVTTFTVDSIGDDKTYHLGVRVGVPPLATPKIPDSSFELLIRPQSPAFGIARAFDARLQGVTFVGFIRRFVGQDGEPEVHWHLSADTPEVVAAVKDVVALAELSGS